MFSAWARIIVSYQCVGDVPWSESLCKPFEHAPVKGAAVVITAHHYPLGEIINLPMVSIGPVSNGAASVL
jgi:hypothetical protein